MTMHIEIARTAPKAYHGRVRSDVGNTEPTWVTESLKSRQSAEKSAIRLAEMFGWRDLAIVWNGDKTEGGIYTSIMGNHDTVGVFVARVVFVDERKATS